MPGELCWCVSASQPLEGHDIPTRRLLLRVSARNNISLWSLHTGGAIFEMSTLGLSPSSRVMEPMPPLPLRLSPSEPKHGLPVALSELAGLLHADEAGPVSWQPVSKLENPGHPRQRGPMGCKCTFSCR